ncbi:hypothetical protein C1852_09870 [Eggerthella lenta]|uniref:Uncharacterized protein n=1 Tax=Eggerthella lenta TaxID=84112 RepID=A0ABD7GI60_EGGLN|nr:hypothetical protein [Eggerthella lenta]RDC24733.1 hypothetical protein C1857_06860 [Eggerthella lenta]RDC36681.1 hypothetical protein C1852_09870 [Eggerthella lenta]RDC37664.1 hypothetical protein C1853_09430 [Eggerthella lenta]
MRHAHNRWHTVFYVYKGNGSPEIIKHVISSFVFFYTPHIYARVAHVLQHAYNETVSGVFAARRFHSDTQQPIQYLLRRYTRKKIDVDAFCNGRFLRVKRDLVAIVAITVQRIAQVLALPSFAKHTTHRIFRALP